MISTIQGFVSSVIRQYKKWDFPQYVWFRGEPKTSTPLLPKLFRPRDDKPPFNENKLLQMFRMKAPTYSSSTPIKGNTDEWLFLAQHVGLPTRLLDWTENALIALYFSLKSENPIVWMLDPMALNTHVMSQVNGQEVEPVAEFPLTWFRPPQETRINIGNENIRGAWENDLRGLDLPVAIQPTYLHPRMSAQRSVFTIHGKRKLPLNELIPKDNKILAKFIINPKCRSKLQKDIGILGIREATAYPDIDGLARELESQH